MLVSHPERRHLYAEKCTKEALVHNGGAVGTREWRQTVAVNLVCLDCHPEKEL